MKTISEKFEELKEKLHIFESLQLKRGRYITIIHEKKNGLIYFGLKSKDGWHESVYPENEIDKAINRVEKWIKKIEML